MFLQPTRQRVFGGSRLLGWIITRAFYSLRLWERDLIAWLSGDCFSFCWIALPADTISSSRNRLFLNFDVFSGKRKNGADASAKKAALLFVAGERNPDPTGRLSIPNKGIL